VSFILFQLHLLTDVCAVPGKRYALTLQLMLKRSKSRKAHSSSSRSPKVLRDPQRSMIIDHPPNSHPASVPIPPYTRVAEPFSPVYEYPAQELHLQGPHTHAMHMAVNPMAQHYPPQLPHPNFTEAEQILRGLEQTDVAQLPVWISDQSLGGQSFSQHGMDAFIIPTEYLPPATQIW